MSDIRVGIRLTADGKDLVGEVRLGARELDKLGGQGRRTGDDMRKYGRDSDYAAQQARGLNASTRALSGGMSLLAGAVAGLSLASLGSDMIATISQMQTLNTRIRRLTGDGETFAETQRFLSETADALSTDLLLLSDQYGRLLVLQDSGLLTQQQSRDLLIGMANAAAALGAENAQLEQSLFGLSQGLASGTLRAEEFNQVTEPLPGLVGALDRAAGLPAGGFRKLVNEGKVTADFFKTTLIKAFAEFDGAAAGMAGNIDQTATRMSNAYTKLKGELEAPISSAVIPVLEGTTAAVRFAADNMDDLADTAELAVLAVGGLLVARTVGPALAAATVATQGLTAAQAMFVAGATAQHAAAMAARAGTVALTTSIYGLRTALMFVGGPAGLAILAGGALAYLATQTKTYNEAAFDARLEQDILNKKMKDGAAAARDLAKSNLQAALSELELKRAALQLENETNISEAYDVVLGPQIAALEARVTSLKQQIAELDAQLAGPPRPSGIEITGGRPDRPGEDADAQVRAFEAHNDRMAQSAASMRERMKTETERMAADLALAREHLDAGLIDEETLFRMEIAYDEHIERLLERNREASISWSQAWAGAFDNFAQGMGNAVADALFTQGDMGEKTLALIGAIAKQTIASLVEIGIRKLVMGTQDKAMMAATQAQGMQMAGTLAGAWAPAAAGAAVATAGGAAAAGSAGLIETYGLASSLALTGIAHGGLDRAKEGTYLLRKDEMVLEPGNSELMRQVLKREASGQGGGRGGDTFVFAPTIQAHDASGFDRLLQSRQGSILNMMRSAYHRNGHRSPI